MMIPNKRYAVFSLKTERNMTIWTRAGNAWVNKDGSMNLYLDVLPIAGRLHVREAGERPHTSPPPEHEPTANETALEPLLAASDMVQQ